MLTTALFLISGIQACSAFSAGGLRSPHAALRHDIGRAAKCSFACNSRVASGPSLATQTGAAKRFSRLQMLASGECLHNSVHSSNA